MANLYNTSGIEKPRNVELEVSLPKQGKSKGKEEWANFTTKVEMQGISQKGEDWFTTFIQKPKEKMRSYFGGLPSLARSNYEYYR